MPIRTETYALARPVPYFLVRGESQTIRAPIRHGVDGALIEPASGTITIESPDGTNLVDGAAVTVTSSIAGYEFTPASTEPLGEGYTVLWTLVFSGVTYPVFRTSAYMVEYVPPNVISSADLYDENPELKYRVPQNQGPNGDNVGWQPQIDAAYYDFLRELYADGRRPWLLREATSYRDFLVARAMYRAMKALSMSANSGWQELAKSLRHEVHLARARMKLQYQDDDPGTRRGGSPIYRFSPTGRPTW